MLTKIRVFCSFTKLGKLRTKLLHDTPWSRRELTSEQREIPPLFVVRPVGPVTTDPLVLEEIGPPTPVDDQGQDERVTSMASRRGRPHYRKGPEPIEGVCGHEWSSASGDV